MAVTLDETRRALLISKLQGFFLAEFDEEVSAFRAEGILDFFLDALGPAVYNQGVQDARGFMMGKLDDLDAEIHEREGG
jgi:uncharacterized protein (DUF2164 family)